MIGFSEMLADRMFGELNPKQVDYVDDIHSSGRRLLSLINDVLVRAYRTLEAESAERGLQLARTERTDLVLMDIQLPGIDGVEALRRRGADSVTAAVTTIAVTASAMHDDRARIEGAGLDGYQPEPILVRDFLAAVRTTLGARRPRG